MSFFDLKSVLEVKSTKADDKLYMKSEENKNGIKDNSDVSLCSTDR